MATTVEELQRAIAALDELPAAAAVWLAIGEKVYGATGAAQFPQTPDFRIVRHPARMGRLTLGQLRERLDNAVDRGGAEWPVMIQKDARDIDAGYYALDFVSTDGAALFCFAEL